MSNTTMPEYVIAYRHSVYRGVDPDVVLGELHREYPDVNLTFADCFEGKSKDIKTIKVGPTHLDVVFSWIVDNGKLRQYERMPHRTNGTAGHCL